jgi:hypothetical protein
MYEGFFFPCFKMILRLVLVYVTSMLVGLAKCNVADDTRSNVSQVNADLEWYSDSKDEEPFIIRMSRSVDNENDSSISENPARKAEIVTKSAETTKSVGQSPTNIRTFLRKSKGRDKEEESLPDSRYLRLHIPNPHINSISNNSDEILNMILSNSVMIEKLDNALGAPKGEQLH